MTDLHPRDLSMPLLLTVEECRRQCRVDSPEEDAELLGYAAAAQAWVETFTGRRLTGRPAIAIAPEWGAWRLMAAPVVSIDSIDYEDSDGAVRTLPADDYLVRDCLGLTVIRLRTTIVGPVLRPESQITIAMTVGHAEGACPPDLKHACLLMVGNSYRNRDAVVTGTIATELPLAVESLCIRHRLTVLP
ncbi:MAG: head-tail connector protein [Sphingomonadaceae bacterium]